jgi:hypothetical protein
MAVSSPLRPAFSLILMLSLCGASAFAAGQASGLPPAGQPPSGDDVTRRAAVELYRKAVAIPEATEEKIKLLTDATVLDPATSTYADALRQARQELADAKRLESERSVKEAQIQQSRQAAAASKVSAESKLDDAYARRRQRDYVAARAAAQESLDLYRAANDAQGVQQATALLKSIDETIALRRKLLLGLGAAALAVLALGGGLFVMLRKRSRRLEMVEGPERGRVFKLSKELTTIGALDADTDVVIADPYRKISRKHCQIARSGRHFFLIDRSRNGTFLNGRAIPRDEPVLLRLNDEITLCDDVILIYR